MKKAINRMKLEMDALPVNERLARNCITAFVAPLDPDLGEISDLRTVLSEAVTNAIIHGYRTYPGKVYITAVIRSDRSVTVKVADKGVGIGNLAEARKPLYTTDPSGERGGMGFAIMENFTDRFRVKSSPGKGTVVTMVKKFGDPEKNNPTAAENSADGEDDV